MRSETTYTCEEETIQLLQLHFSTSNAESLTMNIVTAENASDPPLLKFPIGGAALVFEEAEDWKHRFQDLIVRCNI